MFNDYPNLQKFYEHLLDRRALGDQDSAEFKLNVLLELMKDVDQLAIPKWDEDLAAELIIEALYELRTFLDDFERNGPRKLLHTALNLKTRVLGVIRTWNLVTGSSYSATKG